MKSSTLQSFKSFNIQSDNHLADVEFQNGIQNENFLTDSYPLFDDEPDFDCEFLSSSHDWNESENTIDAESEDDLADEFNDNQWDADIYDPYMESAYY